MVTLGNCFNRTNISYNQSLVIVLNIYIGPYWSGEEEPLTTKKNINRETPDDKEKPLTDLINQLDIADGLKGVLISSGFTLKSPLNASASHFAILGIDPYVAMLVSNAIKKVTIHSLS